MKTQILKMLREQQGYISGQELCDTFQVSRTAVWKVINQLKEEGYQIEAIRNKGYCIKDAPEVLSEKEIKSLMKTNWAGHSVVCLEEVDSTNIEAKRRAEQGAVHGTLIVADRQSAGKGRRGKFWTSPPGTGIWMSILLRPEIAPDKAPMLTLVMAYSVANAIREKEELNAKIKWPNDIVLHKKKICGILTEMSAEIDYINHVVIGVGVNANIDAFPTELCRTATSLKIEKGSAVRRAELLACIMSHFEKNYELFLQSGDLQFLQKDYNFLMVNQDRDVTVMVLDDQYQAHAIGINETGELLVEKEDGSIECVYAGEVSVRGIYGYV